MPTKKANGCMGSLGALVILAIWLAICGALLWGFVFVVKWMWEHS
jgi:hypothetical protein